MADELGAGHRHAGDVRGSARRTGAAAARRLRARADARAHHPLRQPAAPRRRRRVDRGRVRADRLRRRRLARPTCPGFGNWTVRAGIRTRRAIRRLRKGGPLDALFIHTQVPAILVAGPRQHDPDGRVARRHADPVRRARRPLRPRHRRRPRRAVEVAGQHGVLRPRRRPSWRGPSGRRQGLVDRYDVPADKIVVIPPGVDYDRWSAYGRDEAPTRWRRRAAARAVRRRRPRAQGRARAARGGAPPARRRRRRSSSTSSPATTVPDQDGRPGPPRADAEQPAAHRAVPPRRRVLPADARRLPADGAVRGRRRRAAAGVDRRRRDRRDRPRRRDRAARARRRRRRPSPPRCAAWPTIPTLRRRMGEAARRLVQRAVRRRGQRRTPRRPAARRRRRPPGRPARRDERADAAHGVGHHPRRPPTRRSRPDGGRGRTTSRWPRRSTPSCSIDRGAGRDRAARRPCSPGSAPTCRWRGRASGGARCHRVVFTDGEQVGIPYAALTWLVRRRPRHVMIGHVLSPREEGVAAPSAAPAAPYRHARRLRHRAAPLRRRASSATDPTRSCCRTFMVDTDFWRPTRRRPPSQPAAAVRRRPGAARLPDAGRRGARPRRRRRHRRRQSVVEARRTARPGSTCPPT